MNAALLQALPRVARKRLVLIGVGWVCVAVAEAGAYIVLARAITRSDPPGAVLLCAALAVGVTVLVQRAGFLTGARIAGDLYAGLGSVFARARLSWFTEGNRALAGTVAGRVIPSFLSVPAHQLQALIHAPLIPVFILVGIGIIEGVGTAALVGVVVLASFLVQWLAQAWLRRADDGRGAADQAVARASMEFVDHLELLRSAAGPERAVSRMVASWQGQESALARTNKAAALATLASGLATLMPLAAVAILLGVRAGHDPSADLALFVLTLRACAPVEALALAGVMINDLRTALTQYEQVRSAPPLPEPEVARKGNGVQLDLVGVSHLVLADLDARIAPGATVLVTGPTGSGKSTLLGLLMRFDDPQQGRVERGGVDLRDQRFEDVAASVAYVPQDPVVFSGTLAENIQLGDAGASQEQIEAAARRAQLGDVIARDPRGLQQTLGHRGNTLSGGERQRVAIARAFLKEAPILVLDEATSALDLVTEEKIAAEVRSMSDATVVLVTHRSHDIWQPTQRIELGAPNT
ncbi:ABC transporter ATP-binding protein [Gephyromycinifex aptenodytis]|uniref:ABC transporter ATP-binding protein n=1 Tax=Gephyromycinifex aptenodytis TaxID=2716227 RepID=UPI001447FCAE|nr:ABC transporter ATP-binding protein [Gephyromycinifex aptenodytis]